MIDQKQFLNLVVIPVLNYLGLFSKAALVLLLGTAITESELKYLKQLGKGPALGLFQCEPATHKDIWANFLSYNQGLLQKINAMLSEYPINPEQALVTNMAYAVAICRVHYLRVKEKLPEWNDAEAMAAYHKKYYNSVLGKTDPAKSKKHFQAAIDVVSSL